MWKFYIRFQRYVSLRTLISIFALCFHIISIIPEYQLISISLENFYMCLKLVFQCKLEILMQALNSINHLNSSMLFLKWRENSNFCLNKFFFLQILWQILDIEEKQLNKKDVKSPCLKRLVKKFFQFLNYFPSIFDFLKTAYIKCDVIPESGIAI